MQLEITELPCFSRYYSILPESTLLYTASIWDFSSSCLTTSVWLVASWSHNHAMWFYIYIYQSYYHNRLQVSVFCWFCFVLWLDCLGFFSCFSRHRVLETRRCGKEKKAGNLGIIKWQNSSGSQPAVFQAQEAFCLLVGKGYQVSYLVFCCVLPATTAQLH